MVLACILSLVSIAWIIVFSFYLGIRDAIEDRKMESRTCCPVDKCDSIRVDHPEHYEDTNESELIAQAVIATIGTSEEESCFGYNATYVLKVITAECGHDYVLACACCTALLNECKQLKGRQTPEEAIETYKWCKPVDFITEEARAAFIEVFVYGHLDDSIGNSTIFYNPIYMSDTPFHETQNFIVEINGVRFFEER